MAQNISKPITCPSVWIYLVGWTSIIHLLYLILQTDLAWSQAPLKNWRLDHNKLEFLQRYKFPRIALEIDINHLGVSGISPMVASTINTREMDSVYEQKTGDDLESRWLWPLFAHVIVLGSAVIDLKYYLESLLYLNWLLYFGFETTNQFKSSIILDIFAPQPYIDPLRLVHIGPKTRNLVRCPGTLWLWSICWASSWGGSWWSTPSWTLLDMKGQARKNANVGAYPPVLNMWFQMVLKIRSIQTSHKVAPGVLPWV